MDPRKLNDILVATIDPDIDRRKQAEEQLNQVSVFQVISIVNGNQISNLFGEFK